MISQRAIDLIKEFENDPEDYLGRPEWPGGESGVTIGFGWDLGHTPPLETEAAWQKLDPQALSMLLACSGLKGAAAQNALPKVQHLNIPFSLAEQVFKDVTLPRWEARTLAIYPQAAQLGGDCLGALVSLVFNRGPSLSGPRRSEMLEIQRSLAAGTSYMVPSLILNMRRLWPDVAGLRRRREAEAQLFAAGLAASGE